MMPVLSFMCINAAAANLARYSAVQNVAFPIGNSKGRPNRELYANSRRD